MLPKPPGTKGGWWWWCGQRDGAVEANVVFAVVTVHSDRNGLCRKPVLVFRKDKMRMY